MGAQRRCEGLGWGSPTWMRLRSGQVWLSDPWAGKSSEKEWAGVGSSKRDGEWLWGLGGSAAQLLGEAGLTWAISHQHLMVQRRMQGRTPGGP